MANPTRRSLIRTAAVLAGTVPLAGCQPILRRLATADNSGFSPTSYSFESSDLCLLNAEAVRGPFHIPDALVRSDIAEGRAGVPLRVRFRVVEVDGCRPLGGMAVECWHCDAEGNYSGYPSYPPDEFPVVDPDGVYAPENEERFCRGIQFTDAQGFVTFETIIPGWYTPRTPHLHLRVSKPGDARVDAGSERVVLTNQAYFPDALIASLFASEAPYQARGQSPYTNRNDGVIHGSGGADGGFLQMSRDGEWQVGTLTLGVPSGSA